MNVTLSIDEQLVTRARKKADALGKSLNQLIRDYLQRLAGGDDPERSIEEFKRLSVGATRVAGASIATRFMSARSFFDTNVLVYADDKAAPAKQRRALDLVAEHRRAGTGVVSLQVLQEYFVTVTRKLHVDARIARRKVELLAEFDVAAPDLADILAPSISTGFTGFPSGMLWSYGRPNRRAVAYCSQKTCNNSERLMGSAS